MSCIAPAGPPPEIHETVTPGSQGTRSEMKHRFGIFMHAEMSRAQQEPRHGGTEGLRSEGSGSGGPQLPDVRSLQHSDNEGQGGIHAGEGGISEEYAEVSDEEHILVTVTEGLSITMTGSDNLPDFGLTAEEGTHKASDPVLPEEVTAESDDISLNMRTRDQISDSPSSNGEVQRELPESEHPLLKTITLTEGLTAEKEAPHPGLAVDTNVTSGSAGSEDAGSRQAEAHMKGGAPVSGFAKAAAYSVSQSGTPEKTAEEGTDNAAVHDAESGDSEARAVTETMEGDEGLSGDEKQKEHTEPAHAARRHGAPQGTPEGAARYHPLHADGVQGQAQEHAVEWRGTGTPAANPAQVPGDALSRIGTGGPENTTHSEGIRTDGQGTAPLHSPAAVSGVSRSAEHPLAAQSLKMDGIRDIVDSIVYVVRGSNKLGVTVDHRSFGRVDISLSQEKGLISVHVHTSDRVLREFMENNVQHIVDSLQEEGISVGDFTVALKQRDRQNTEQPRWDSGTAAAHEENIEQMNGRTGLVNIFA